MIRCNMVQKCLFILGLTLFSLSILSANPDEALFDLYFRNARQSYQTGRYQDALDLLSRADDFNDLSSDFWYLQFLIGRSTGLPGWRLHYLLEKACSFDQWSYYDRHQAIMDLSEISLTQGKLDFAHEWVDRYDGQINDVRYIKLFASILIQKELIQEAAEFLQLYRNTSFEVELIDLLLVVDSRFRDSFVSEVFENRRTPTLYQLEILIDFQQDSAVRLRGLYRDEGGTDIRYLPWDHAAWTARSITEMSDTVFFDYHQYLYLYNRLDFEQKQYLIDRIRTYSGHMFLDIDRNGIREYFAEYDQGKLTKVVIDYNQDDFYEYEIYFRDGTPYRMICAQTTDIYYQEYPQISRIEHNYNQIQYSFQYDGHPVVLDILDYDYSTQYGIVSVHTEHLSESDLFRSATSWEAFRMNGDSINSAVRNSVDEEMFFIQNSSIYPFASDAEIIFGVLYSREFIIEGDSGNSYFIKYEGESQQVQFQSLEDHQKIRFNSGDDSLSWDYDLDGNRDFRSYSLDGYRVMQFDFNDDGDFEYHVFLKNGRISHLQIGEQMINSYLIDAGTVLLTNKGIGPSIIEGTFDADLSRYLRMIPCFNYHNICYYEDISYE